ncbi:MAG TPA: hypothetical protein VNG69_11920 [Casimicrobiaceae bacterium]|nr:hypothetical protein [Casimicrobiaceae bacterium]
MTFNRSHRLLVVAILVATAVGIAATRPWVERSAPAVATALERGQPVGSIDRPVDELIVSRALRIAGWAMDRDGEVAVDARIAGRTIAATTGIARPDVALAKSDYPAAGRSGFALDVTLDNLRALRWPIEITATNRNGSTLLGRRSLAPPEALQLWRRFEPATADAFHFLMATSGLAQGGANEIADVYRGYGSATQRIGMAVPVLYMRTTHGRARDFTFDPNFDVSRKCGARALADDSLANVLRYAIDQRVPVQIILNGGIWADASCDAPQWDVNDHLEADPRNCQWTQDDKVFPDDHLKNLAGSTQSPELARSLTLNVYAGEVRRYKKRNLKAAAALIAAFAREHPTLFVGVNLDSDTYANPFFEQREWFDYNPGTLRQFREWLQRSGPYAGHGSRDVPDLRAFRRAKPMTLAAVNRVANASWKRWEEVQPPRTFPGSEHQPLKNGERLIWDDPWFQLWDTFRKHLVQLHYDELAQWTHEAGIAKDRIFTAQGFVAPEGPARPFAVRVTSAGQNYDSGGVSIEGSIPRAGHLGAILYGPAAMNRARMEHRHGLFATFARMDAGWAVVESNLADLRRPEKLPTYGDAYRAFRDLFNYDAKQVSLMAWNGSNGIYAGQPGYVSYTSWRNTPAEEAMRDHLVSHAGLPLGSRLWMFGSAQHRDDDGWSAEGAAVVLDIARLRLQPKADAIRLLSPPDQVIRARNARSLVIGIAPDVASRIEVWAQLAPDGSWTLLNHSPSQMTEAGIEVPLRWPETWRDDSIIERLRINLIGVAPGREFNVDRIALIGTRTAPAR